MKIISRSFFCAFWITLTLWAVMGIASNATSGHPLKVLVGFVIVFWFGGNAYLWGKDLFGRQHP